MAKQRIERLNSLLREVISDVIRKHVRNPDVNELFTITRVSISKDLRHAKVYVSILGEENEKAKSIKALQSASGFIGSTAAKQVVMRFFPSLKFLLDDAVNKHMRIEELLHQIEEEKNMRPQGEHENGQ